MQVHLDYVLPLVLPQGLAQADHHMMHIVLFQEKVSLQCKGERLAYKIVRRVNASDKSVSTKWQGALEGDWEHPSSTASHQ